MSAGGVIKTLRALGIVGRGDIVSLDCPVAYRGPWPIRSHRTVAEVDESFVTPLVADRTGDDR